VGSGGAAWRLLDRRPWLPLPAEHLAIAADRQNADR
jgi:hypothetical protein